MNDRARRRALTAVCLDCTWVTALVIADPAHTLAAAIGGSVLALGALAVQVRWIGYLLSPVRAFGALLMLVLAADRLTVLLLLLVAAVVSAFDGVLAARASRTGQRSQRFDEVGSAILHGAFIGLIVIALLVQRRFAAADGFVLFWIAISWGTIAVHEAGHAIAALRTDNAIANVRIGIGLTLLRVGNVSIGANPFGGRTRWVPNESSMTSRREVYIALAGPAANLITALALFSLPFVRADGLGVVVITVHVGMALVNLIPLERDEHGHHLASDGARALRLLRS